LQSDQADMRNRVAAQIRKRSGVFWEQKAIDGFLLGKEDKLGGVQRDPYDIVNVKWEAIEDDSSDEMVHLSISA